MTLLLSLGSALISFGAAMMCPKEVDVLVSVNSTTASKYFDKHHQKVKRKGIAFIIVMSAVVFTIVFMIEIWYK